MNYNNKSKPSLIELTIDFDYILDEETLPEELFSNASKFYYCFITIQTCGIFDQTNSTISQAFV